MGAAVPLPQSLENRVLAIEERLPLDQISIVIMSGDLDRQLAAFIIATGAAAMGTRVRMFFTFWGISSFRDPERKPPQKNFISRMFAWMLPRGTSKLKLSKMDFGGLGRLMMKSLMKKKNVPSLEDLIAIAAETGVEVEICEMSMGLMGFQRGEMRDYPGLSYCGVAKFLHDSGQSKNTLFI